MEFQKLFENVMIRSTSEAQCESIGSIMNQHFGKNQNNNENKCRFPKSFWCYGSEN